MVVVVVGGNVTVVVTVVVETEQFLAPAPAVLVEHMHVGQTH